MIKPIPRNEKALDKVELWLQLKGVERFGLDCLNWEYERWAEFQETIKEQELKEIIRNDKILREKEDKDARHNTRGS
jgi:hypothetical protein